MKERQKLIRKKSNGIRDSAIKWLDSGLSMANSYPVARSIQLSSSLDGYTFRAFAKKVLGCIILCLSICGGSAIGVVSDQLPVDSPFVKNSWRASMILIYFFIPVLIENYFLFHKTNYRAMFSRKTYPIVLMACLC